MRFEPFIALALFACEACDETPPGPPPPDPIVTQAQLDSDEMVEVVACRQSHEHELNHVRTIANAAGADWYRRCVLDPAAVDHPCTDPFPEGALFVKLEFELEGCKPEDYKGLTVNKKLAPGSYPAGRDWHWQRLTTKLKVVEDGAPQRCLLCHIDHCSPPYGYDMRCLPD